MIKHLHPMIVWVMIRPTRFTNKWFLEVLVLLNLDRDMYDAFGINCLKQYKFNPNWISCTQSYMCVVHFFKWCSNMKLWNKCALKGNYDSGENYMSTSFRRWVKLFINIVTICHIPLGNKRIPFVRLWCV